MRRRFLRYVLGRAAAAIVLIFIVASAALLLAQLAPGDYASQFGANPAEIAAERHRLGLDRPFGEQYASWFMRTLTLDLGESFRYRQPVTMLVRTRARNTALLAIASLALATLLGIAGGILTGSSKGPMVSLVRGISITLLSVPPLITSLLLLTIAARTGLLPVGGMGTGARSVALHLVIPALALGLPMAATIERFQAQALREALARPSTMAARARGVPRSRIVGRHAWRLSLGPLLAVYGVLIGSVFSGSFAVELVTAWPGLGDLMREALMARDTYLVAGCAAAGALFLAAGVFAADVAHGALDPRVEASHRS